MRGIVYNVFAEKKLELLPYMNHEQVIKAWDKLALPDMSFPELKKRMDRDDTACLEIYRVLRTTYWQIGDKLKIDPCENILGIYFVCLLWSFTSAYLIKQEIERNEQPEELINNPFYGINSTFPYLSYSQVAAGNYDGWGRGKNVKGMQPPSFKNRCVQFLSSINFLNNGKIALANIPQHILITKKLLKKNYTIVYPEQFKIYFPHFDAQWEILENNITALNKKGITISEAMLDRYKGIVMSSMSDVPISPNWDVLVTGTLFNIHARIVAANTYRVGKPVVTIAHGESYGEGFIQDYPYREKTYCTHYIGFGICPEEKNYGYENTDWLTPPPREIPANSNPVMNIYSKKNIMQLSRAVNPTIMYAPNALEYNVRSGPYRDIADGIYLNVQRKILRQLDVSIYKPHPKSPYWGFSQENWRKLLQTPRLRIEYDDFKDCCLDADVLVVDYLSTASAYAFATNKPVVFLDFGFQHCSPECLEIVKKRCVYVNVFELYGESIRDVVQLQKEKKCVNEYTERYSIVPDLAEKREKTVLQMLKKCCKRV